jgi:Abnormal spindle-like microcephaly-assoc'd, ASPM-SPD-2-Hydin
MPVGYASPCPVWAVSPASISQSQTLTLSATPQAGTDYIYTTAYYAQGSTWTPVTLTGNNAAPSYSSGPATGSLTPTILSTLPLGTNYIVLWDWLWDSTSQCYKGPGLNQCNTGTWRLQTFNLTASTQGSAVSISPTTLTFPATQVGTTSPTQYVTVTNTGNTVIASTLSSFTGDFDSAGSGTCVLSLAVGVSCTYSVHFIPTAAGTRTGTLTINDNAPGAPHIISLTGTGVVTSPTPTPSTSPVGCATGCNNYYVSTTGSDSNAGTQASPWKTIRHCDQSLTLGTGGAICHVAPGTYNSNDASLEIITTHNGSASQPIIFQSDTKWGAKIVCNGTPGNFGYCWEAQGNYQVVKDFEIVGGSSPQPTAVGLRLTGGSVPTHNIQAVGNLVHNFAPECNHTAGLGGAGIINNGNTASNSFIGNVVYDIGVNPPSGGYNVCSLHTGLYMASPGGVVENNIVYQVDFTGILTWHGATGLAITNNTVFHIGRDAILIGCGDSGCTSNISNTLVANNIIRNSNNAIRTEGSVGPNNVCTNNDLFANTTNFIFDSGTTPCAQSANLTSDPQMASFSLTPGVPSVNGGVVSWPSASFRLASGSPAIAAGRASSSCLSGGASPCIPSTDFSGKVRPNPPSIGPYEF